MKITKPKKVDGATLNTWIVDVDGNVMTTLLDGELDGEIEGRKIWIEKRILTVRFTSDTYETLSVTDERTGVQFNVPFKKVDKMIALARNERKGKQS